MRVSVDDKAHADPRFDRLGARLKMNRHEAIGRCLRPWNFAYQSRSPIMSIADVDALADRVGFAKAMIKVELADKHRNDRVRLRGVEERIQFLIVQDSKRAMANAARAALREVPPGKPLDEERRRKPASPGKSPGGVPVTSDLDVDLATASDSDPEAVAVTEQTLIASLPASASGWKPSPAGRAITRWKERGLSTDAFVAIWQSFCEKTAGAQFNDDKHRDNALAKFVGGYKPSRTNPKRARRSDDHSKYLEGP